MINSSIANLPNEDRWTRLNITLHWLIVVLLAFQFFIGEWMVAFFDGGIEGKTMDALTVTFGYLHVVIGLSIFVAIALRLWDRLAHGRPPHWEGEPNWASVLARITHFGLYALLLIMPLAGLVSWWFSNEWIGDQHVLASNVLMAFVALHIAGALANHFWFKTDVLRRILPGQGRKT
ncbi:MAG: hypothetical protein CMN55_03700 [Sneathiella sp.]|jgi:cytochrome b561|uniref:cytochrome b n=1 Tax=Sneathiella sp. TaxID=1964365 RepID=UPI000C3D7F66|nr:cytochrome b/b6 domain-containing protein [Sneathiella sp.]MAL78208.1 hypothetical protein [Sneathiella sp.]|tara:strand:- start:7534 stop:8064 length:531 start_codon:yes stop_codon:yes gene_type:complete